MSGEALFWVGLPVGLILGVIGGTVMSPHFFEFLTARRRMLHDERMALFAQRERMLFHRGDEP